MPVLSNHSMRSINFLLCYILALLTIRCSAADSNITTRIIKGFVAKPATSDAKFEPFITDVTGVFAFGFWHISSTKLDLAVVHLPSNQAVWRANPFNLPNWSNSTTLSFDGNLILTDETVQAGPVWSTKSPGGDFLVLSNNSNLQLFASTSGDSPLWQSFDYPFDTLVQGQIFSSATTASLVTADRKYTLRIGIAYLALFMEFQGGEELNYWKHTALKANALKDIYAQVDGRGFLGIYYVRDGSFVDRIPFDSFERGLGFHRLVLQSDGNLYAYYWDNERWVSVYTALTEPCGLPSTCGAYGICIPGSPHQCSCLINGTDGCLQTDPRDFCGNQDNGFAVVRKDGITVEYTDIMETIAAESLSECEKICEQSCVCWGALYSATAKNCYIMDYPIQTVERSGSAYKGYFKIRSKDGSVYGTKHGNKDGNQAVIAVAVILAVLFAGIALYGGYWWWEKSQNQMPVIQLGGNTKHEMIQKTESNYDSDSSTEFKKAEV